MDMKVDPNNVHKINEKKETNRPSKEEAMKAVKTLISWAGDDPAGLREGDGALWLGSRHDGSEECRAVFMYRVLLAFGQSLGYFTTRPRAAAS